MSETRLRNAFVVRVEGPETLVVIQCDEHTNRDVLAMIDTKALNDAGINQRGDRFSLLETFTQACDEPSTYADFERIEVSEEQRALEAQQAKDMDRMLRELEQPLPTLKPGE